MAESRRTRGRLAIRAERSAFTRRFYLPAHEFIRIEWVGSALLLAAALLALALANSPFGEAYHDLWETYITLDLGILQIRETIRHWINDGLMAVFFFVVGLEIKRELLHGNLSDPRRAAFPALVAVGGMVVPRLSTRSSTPAAPRRLGGAYRWRRTSRSRWASSAFWAAESLRSSGCSCWRSRSWTTWVPSSSSRSSLRLRSTFRPWPSPEPSRS